MFYIYMAIQGYTPISDTPKWNVMGTSWTMLVSWESCGMIIGYIIDDLAIIVAEKMEDVVRWIKQITRKDQRWAVFHDLVDRYPLIMASHSQPTSWVTSPTLMIGLIITKQPSLFNYITIFVGENWKLSYPLVMTNIAMERSTIFNR